MRSSAEALRASGLALFCLALVALPGGSPAVTDDAPGAALDAVVDLMVHPPSDRAQIWVCKPSVMHVCTNIDCRPAAPSGSVKLDLAERTYARCDANGCDEQPMEIHTSGEFTVFRPGQEGSFLKALNDGSEYVEMTTLGLTVHQNHGSCAPAN